MEHLKVLSYGEMNPEAQEILAGVKSKLGRIPNVYGVMAHSPAALKAFLLYRDTLAKGELNSKEIETVALVVSQHTDCLYCVAAHTVIAKMQGLSEEETLLLRKAKSSDPKLAALAELTIGILAGNGQPSSEAVQKFFKAGYGKAALAEVIAQIASNIFTSYLNKMAPTPVDYPAVKKVG